MSKDEVFLMDEEKDNLKISQSAPLERQTSEKIKNKIALHGSSANLNWVVSKFREFQSEDPDQALPVAAVKTLVEVLRQSSANTLMGLEIEVKNSIAMLTHAADHDQLALSSACELFGRFVTKKTKTIDDFNLYKSILIQRGEKYAEAASKGREKVASFADNFISDGTKILTNGFSRTILEVLKKSMKKGKRFSVMITESRPDDAGYILATRLSSYRIPCEIISDSAVAHKIDMIDMVLVGAESICENGGILNKIGTYQISIVSKAFKKPVYVCAESFKFMRFYPLNQRDMDWRAVMFPQIPVKPKDKNIHDTKNNNNNNNYNTINSKSEIEETNSISSGSNSPILSPYSFPEQLLTSTFPKNTPRSNNTHDKTTYLVSKVDRDYTPPSLITLLFTDLGILTPSAVSDELIKLY